MKGNNSHDFFTYNFRLSLNSIFIIFSSSTTLHIKNPLRIIMSIIEISALKTHVTQRKNSMIPIYLGCLIRLYGPVVISSCFFWIVTSVLNCFPRAYADQFIMIKPMITNMIPSILIHSCFQNVYILLRSKIGEKIIIASGIICSASNDILCFFIIFSPSPTLFPSLGISITTSIFMTIMIIV